MNVLRAPWRMAYIHSAQDKTEKDACIFCLYPTENKDKENLIVARGHHVFAILNRYPYSSGHLMIVPYKHTAALGSLKGPALLELMHFAQKACSIMETIMGADGINLGMNLGKAAGAGIDSHLHLHVVPRWNGDTNFMSVTAETKVLPVALSETHERLSSAWDTLEKR